MKCLSPSRNFVVAVLVLLLAAASAPAALALPAGPGGGGGAGWDVQAFFHWVQGLLGGFLGGGEAEEAGPTSITGKQRTHSDPNGGDLTSTSTGETMDVDGSLEEEALGR